MNQVWTETETSWWHNNWVFPKCFHWMQWIQWQFCFKNKNDCCTQTYYLLCKRQRWYRSTTTTQVTEMILKFTLIHSSVIYQFLWICWIQWKFVLFGENSNNTYFCRIRVRSMVISSSSRISANSPPWSVQRVSASENIQQKMISAVCFLKWNRSLIDFSETNCIMNWDYLKNPVCYLSLGKSQII